MVWLASALLVVAAPLPSAGAGATYFWPNVRGNAGEYGVSNLTAPKDLSRPSWRWHHEKGQYGTVVVGGPVIDHERNLYFASMTDLIKMSPDGRTIWRTNPPPFSLFPDGPSIHDGGVFQTLTSGSLCKYRMDSGQQVWCRKYYPEAGSDSKYVTSHDGVVVIGSDNAQQFGGGSRHILGVDAETGNLLWDFQPDTPTWNNNGMFTLDDTVVLQDWDAKVYRLGLHNGSLLWKSGGSDSRTWTDGGTIIGANGIVYAAFALNHQFVASTPYLGGGVSAYRMSDGEQLWSRFTQHGVYTWPVAGQLHDDDRWTVIIASGAIPSCDQWHMRLKGELLSLWPYGFLACWFVLELAFFMQPQEGKRRAGWLSHSVRLVLSHSMRLALAAVLCALVAGVNTARWASWMRSTYPAEILAVDGETGSVRWHYDLPPWKKISARGDEEGTLQRNRDTPWRGCCCPASFGSPSVDGNGVVYIGHVSGSFFAIKDRNGDGWIDEDSEVQVFDAEAAFLHSGPAFAPGLFAFSTCDSVWVWNT